MKRKVLFKKMVFLPLRDWHENLQFHFPTKEFSFDIKTNFKLFTERIFSSSKLAMEASQERGRKLKESFNVSKYCANRKGILSIYLSPDCFSIHTPRTIGLREKTFHIVWKVKMKWKYLNPYQTKQKSNSYDRAEMTFYDSKDETIKRWRWRKEMSAHIIKPGEAFKGTTIYFCVEIMFEEFRTERSQERYFH